MILALQTCWEGARSSIGSSMFVSSIIIQTLQITMHDTRQQPEKPVAHRAGNRTGQTIWDQTNW